MDKATIDTDTPQNPTKVLKKPIKTIENPTSVTAKIPTEIIQTNKDKEINVYKMKEYKIFLALCKRGDYISARITAKSLGVNPMTIVAWNKTSAVRKALEDSVATHVRGMAKYGHKDWRMHDKMLDRIEDSVSTKENNSVDLKQMIVINT